MILAIYIISLAIIAGFLNYYIRRYKMKRTNLSRFISGNLVKINGINTHILIKGEGEPLIFVHGSQMSLYDFRYNIDFFSKHFKVYAFDMVGCGFTDKPKASYSPEYFAMFINGIMDFYNIEKASFVASSWGGGHVFYFALKYPEKVKKLVMSSPCGIPHKMISVFALLGIPIISNFLMLFVSKALTKFIMFGMVYRKELVDKDCIDSIYFPLLTKGCICSTVKSYINADFTYVRKKLEKIDSPVLLIWGTRDSVHEKWMMDEMRKRLKNSSLYIIENVGHLPHEEAFDEFNKQALEFLIQN